MDHQRLYWNPSLSISILPAILLGLAHVGAWIVIIKKAHAKGRKPMPPGPRSLPIIGHLHLLGKLPPESLYELSKVHGPLMLLHLGSIPVVVASSPDMACQILKHHDHAFAHRRITKTGKHLFGPKSVVLSSANDPHWKLARRICASELFSPKQLTRFKPLRASAAREVMRSVLADSIANQTAFDVALPGGLCCLRPKLLHAFNDLITSMITGKTLTELAGKDATRVVELIEKLTKLMWTFNVSDYLPFLAWMDLQGLERRSKKVAIGMREVFDRIIEARRLQAAGVARKDAHILDVLLEYASSSSTAPNISVMENFVELITGGTDTMATTIEWALAELILNQEKMHLVQEEIDQVVGRARMVEEEDIAQLPYLVACVKETMRLHPVAPLLVPHETKTHCEILNFQIPPNSEAYVNVWAIGRDPLVWENPLQFLPERFLKVADPIDIQGQHFELAPFGAGRRVCPGIRLAVPSIHFILACLLQGFEWNASPCECIDMTNHFGIVMSMKKPLVAYTKPRLSKDLYTLL